MKTRIICQNDSLTIEIQRAKFKHWFRYGQHRETDVAFMQALAEGAVEWPRKIINRGQLFPEK